MCFLIGFDIRLLLKQILLQGNQEYKIFLACVIECVLSYVFFLRTICLKQPEHFLSRIYSAAFVSFLKIISKHVRLREKLLYLKYMLYSSLQLCWKHFSCQQVSDELRPRFTGVMFSYAHTYRCEDQLCTYIKV